jgi:predicted enzyme related to lactoylglutathione lyase
LPTGGRNENLHKAIAFYEATLRVRKENAFPTEWAETQDNLGVAHARLTTGDYTENLRRAIAFYEAALQIRTEEGFPFHMIIKKLNNI